MVKTNSGLVKYCLDQVGKPYWYGTFGQTATASLLAEKKKQYPAYYTANDFSKQFGKRVHDCAGLPKGYLWSSSSTATPKYNAKQDYGANGLYTAAKQKGTISSFKKVPGQLVFKGTAAKKTHVGVYVGNNKVVEAKGHAYGVITSSITSGWTYWAQCHLITDDISAVTQPAEPPKTTPTTNEVKYITTAVHGLNVRKGPSKNYGIVKCLPKNTKVTVYETKNGWGRIGTNQWCSMTYMKKV